MDADKGQTTAESQAIVEIAIADRAQRHLRSRLVASTHMQNCIAVIDILHTITMFLLSILNLNTILNLDRLDAGYCAAHNKIQTSLPFLTRPLIHLCQELRHWHIRSP